MRACGSPGPCEDKFLECALSLPDRVRGSLVQRRLCRSLSSRSVGGRNTSGRRRLVGRSSWKRSHSCSTVCSLTEMVWTSKSGPEKLRNSLPTGKSTVEELIHPSTLELIETKITFRPSRLFMDHATAYPTTSCHPSGSRYLRNIVANGWGVNLEQPIGFSLAWWGDMSSRIAGQRRWIAAVALKLNAAVGARLRGAMRKQRTSADTPPG